MLGFGAPTPQTQQPKPPGFIVPQKLYVMEGGQVPVGNKGDVIGTVKGRWVVRKQQMSTMRLNKHVSAE